MRITQWDRAIEADMIFVGDVHIQNNNHKQIDVLIKDLLELKSITTTLVFLGDILHYHGNLKTPCLNKAYEMFSLLARHFQRVIVLVGNHDYVDEREFLSSEHWMQVLKNISGVVVIDEPRTICSSPYIIATPYVPKGMLIKALEKVDENWNVADLVLCHQEIKGCVLRKGADIDSSIVSEEGDKWIPDYPLLIAGHIHERQNPSANIHYVGSSTHTSFSERNDKKYLTLINFGDNGLFQLYEKELNISIRIQKQMNVEEFTQFVKEEDHKDKELFKIIVEDSFENIAKLKQLVKDKAVNVPETVKLQMMLNSGKKQKNEKRIQMANRNFVDVFMEACAQKNLSNYFRTIVSKLK